MIVTRVVSGCAVMVATLAWLVGCGDGGDHIDAAALPLVPDVRVTYSTEDTVGESHPPTFARYLLVTGPTGVAPEALAARERALLISRSWHFEQGVTAASQAAYSPDRCAFVSFDTVQQDIQDARAKRVGNPARVDGAERIAAARSAPALSVFLEPTC